MLTSPELMAVIGIKELKNWRSDSSLPFSIIIKKNDHNCLIECQQILRLIRKKRIVAKALFQDQEVLVKIFIGSGYQRRFNRELTGAQLFSAHNIQSPAIVFSYQDNNLAIILFQWLGDTVSMHEQWSLSSDDATRQALLTKAILLIANFHQQGIQQADIHLDNFLVTEDHQIHAIDGDQVEFFEPIKGKGLPVEKSIKNLALFFAQFPPKYNAYIASLHKLYCHTRKIKASDLPLNLVLEELIKARKWREIKFIDKKVFKNCTRFKVRKSWRNFLVYDQTIQPALLEKLKTPDTFALFSSAEIIKQSTLSSEAIITVDKQKYVITRYPHNGLVNVMAHCLAKTKAEITWRNAHLLYYCYKIPTPKPIALTVDRFGPFRSCSYLITEYVGGITLSDVLDPQLNSSQNHRPLAMTAQELILSMISCRLVHGDLKFANILVTDNNLMLINLESLQSPRSAVKFQLAFAKDIQRFTKDCQGFVEFEALVLLLQKALKTDRAS